MVATLPYVAFIETLITIGLVTSLPNTSAACSRGSTSAWERGVLLVAIIAVALVLAVAAAAAGGSCGGDVDAAAADAAGVLAAALAAIVDLTCITNKNKIQVG